MTRRLYFLIALLVFALAVHPPASAAAQSVVGFGPAGFENHFPAGLTFKIHVQSSAGKIVSARLNYSLRNDPSVTVVNVPVEPSASIDLSYLWDTSKSTIPPSSPVTCYWEVTLEDGSKVRSPDSFFRFDDVNHNWNVLEDERIAVWWHNRPNDFGKQVYDIAGIALDQQAKLFGAGLDDQIRIIIYNDFDEFAAWHNYIGEFIGGQAFPALGITTQIVPDAGSQDWWLYEVIPHEISHLYFYQVTRHPIVTPPAWLNEGVAQYNEFVEHGQELSYVEDIVWDGELVRLQAITGNFGGVNEEQVRLAYAESLSAVTYLVETWGTEGLSALLAAYKDGKDTGEAFPAALGVAPADFEEGWLAWIGVPPEMYPSPTPYPTLAAIPTADLVYKTRTPTAPLDPSTPTAEQSPTPAPTDTGVPAAPLPRSIVPAVSLSLLCIFAACLAVLAVLAILFALLLKKKA